MLKQPFPQNPLIHDITRENSMEKDVIDIHTTCQGSGCAAWIMGQRASSQGKLKLLHFCFCTMLTCLGPGHRLYNHTAVRYRRGSSSRRPELRRRTGSISVPVASPALEQQRRKSHRARIDAHEARTHPPLSASSIYRLRTQVNLSTTYSCILRS